MRGELETTRKDLGGAYKMIHDSVPRPPNRKKGHVVLSQLYSPLCGCKCLSTLLREHKLSWVTQEVFPHQLNLTRALLWPAGALTWQPFTKQLQYRRKPGLQ